MQRIGFTDKHTVHSYAPVYERLFSPRKDTTRNVAEIGVLEGGSIKVWEETFQHANIYGLDINLRNVKVKYGPRVTLHQANAYDSKFAATLPSFDIVIDDGPHSLESMKQVIHLYLPKLNDKGVLVIEDVQQISWVDDLRKCVPEHLRHHIQVQDLRNVKKRYDDILFIVDLAA